jgi:hypothetical protein
MPHHHRCELYVRIGLALLWCDEVQCPPTRRARMAEYATTADQVCARLHSVCPMFLRCISGLPDALQQLMHRR